MSGCLTENVVAELVAGSLAHPDLEAAETHLDSCASCRELLAHALHEEPPEPPRIGRYRVLRKVGSGSMGRVYAADDPDLEREVAIKVLRPSAAGDSDAGRARFVREARAMARLSHPNVITVHEVGTADGQRFIVMELVKGTTLGGWLRLLDSEAARGWREVAEVMCAAGHGLAAAHAAGVVHRDFKPDNVLVGSDGRVRVTDFGLAHLAAGEATLAAELHVSAPPLAQTIGLTAGGALIGTPAYMAPEQLNGDDANEHSDLFSFCITFWEALYGERPFAGCAFDELADAVAAGKLRPRPPGREVPDALHEALRRGLAVAPDARWPSMTALLGAVTATLASHALAPRPAGIFGRQRELERADAALVRARSGVGTLLLVTGEAGIGKSRLAREVAARAAASGMRVLWGRCCEVGGAMPYWPWIQIFRSLGVSPLSAPAIGVGEASREQRFHLFDAAARAIETAARREPLAIFLDDLHAADVASLLLLLFVTRQLASVPVLFFATARELETRASPEVSDALARLAREADAISLGRLTQKDVVAWVAHRGGAADAAEVFRITEGNALFVEEVLRVGTDGQHARLSDGIKAVLDAHLGRLSPATRAILAVASVIGRRFCSRELAGLIGMAHDEVLDALHRAGELGVIESAEPGQLQFTHVLLGERLYDSLSRARRHELHWKAGLVFEGSAADAMLAARHLVEGVDAGTVDHAARATLRAAEQALRELAFESAVALTERALALPGLSALMSCMLEVVHGEALQRSGNIDAGRERCLHAAELARALGAGAGLARAALAYACEPVAATIEPVMVRLLEEALSAVGASDVALAARVQARLSVALTPPSTYVEAVSIQRHALAALAAARRLDDPETLLYVLTCVVYSAAGYLMSSDERIEVAHELVTLAQAHAPQLALMRAGPYYASLLRERGRRADSDAWVATLADLHAALDSPPTRWRLPLLRSAFALFDGDVAAAERHSDEALAMGERAGIASARVVWAIQRIAIAIAIADPGRIVPDAEAWIALMAPNPTLAAVRAWLLAAMGRRAEAALLLRQLPATPYVLLNAAESCKLLEDRDIARQLYPLLQESSADQCFFWGRIATAHPFGPGSRLLGDMALILGDTAAARRHHEESAGLCRRIGAPLFAALSDAALARI